MNNFLIGCVCVLQIENSSMESQEFFFLKELVKENFM